MVQAQDGDVVNHLNGPSGSRILARDRGNPCGDVGGTWGGNLHAYWPIVLHERRGPTLVV